MFSYEILTPAALNFFVNYADGAVGGYVLKGLRDCVTGISCSVALCKLLWRLAHRMLVVLGNTRNSWLPAQS